MPGDLDITSNEKNANADRVSARYLLRFVRAAQSLGARLPVLLEAIGISEVDLRDPTGQLPTHMVERLLFAAQRELKDPMTPARMGSASIPKSFSDLTYGTYFMPTLGAAMMEITRVQQEGQKLFVTRIDRGEHITRLTFDYLNSAQPVHADLVQMMLSLYMMGSRDLIRDETPCFEEIGFDIAPPPHADAVRSWFNCPVRYGVERSYAVVANDLLAMPLPRANRLVVRLFHSMVDDLLNEPSDILRPCMLYLYEEMDKSPPTLARTATAMGLTERTLRRRIRDEGTTFRNMLEMLRKQLCGLYIAEGTRSIEEIAQLLGYSETSAFTRAHMRWYGVPPSRATAPFTVRDASRPLKG